MGINAETVDGYNDPRVLNPLWLRCVSLGDGGKGGEHLYKTLGGRWGGGSNERCPCQGGEGQVQVRLNPAGAKTPEWRERKMFAWVSWQLVCQVHQSFEVEVGEEMLG